MNVAASLPYPAPLELRVGDHLGRLEILGHLADGGMARLWLARGRLQDARRWFAIKTVLPSVGASDPKAYEEMLVSEAELACRVRHPNVVKTFGVGRYEGHPYIVQELVVGMSVERLLRLLAENGLRLPVGWVVQIGIGVARGLHGIHTAAGADGMGLGLVHRDINSSNVLISSLGTPQVIDFGVAKSLHMQPTSSVTFKGTIRFSAPEQLRGARVDARADLHALGVMLHDSLTGERLFEESTFLELAERTGSAPALRERLPEVPRELDRLLELLTAGEANRRPTTALEVAHVLERIARDVSTPGSELLGRLARVARRERPARELGRLGLASALHKSSGVRPLTRPQHADEPTRDDRRAIQHRPRHASDVFDQPTAPFAAPYAETIRASVAPDAPGSVVRRTFAPPREPVRSRSDDAMSEPDTVTDAWSADETATDLDWDVASLRAASAIEAFASPETVGPNRSAGREESSSLLLEGVSIPSALSNRKSPAASSRTASNEVDHAVGFIRGVDADSMAEERTLAEREPDERRDFEAHEPESKVDELPPDAEPIYDAIFDEPEPIVSVVDGVSGRPSDQGPAGDDAGFEDVSSAVEERSAVSEHPSDVVELERRASLPKRRKRERHPAVNLPGAVATNRSARPWSEHAHRLGVAAWLLSAALAFAWYFDVLDAAGWPMAGLLLVGWALERSRGTE